MIRINLLPKKVSKKKAGVIQHLAIGGGVIFLVLAGMGYYWVVLNSQMAELAKQIRQQETEKDRLKNVNEEKARQEKTAADLQNKITIIEKLQKERIVPVRLVDELTKVLDSTMPIWLSKYTYTPSGISMDGFSLSHEALRPFVEGLEKSPYYGRVELLFSERQRVGDRDVYRFSIQAKVEQPQG